MENSSSPFENRSRPPRLVLASGSPARLTTLHQAGIEPEVAVSGVDETIAETTPADYVLRLAHRKAQAVATSYRDEAVLVLGCDSILEFDGELLGKPSSPAQATVWRRRMRGRIGVLHTGHCVIDTTTSKVADGAAATTVCFADVSDAEIDAYVATGEPLAVAGGFTIDGLGGAFVDGIDGDHHTVVGLSLPLLRRLLADLGVAWTDFWASETG